MNPPRTPLTIWCSLSFSPEMRRQLEASASPHRVIYAGDAAASNLKPNERDPRLVDDVQVVYGQPHLDDCMQSRSLRYIQLSSAGYTKYDRDDLKDSLRSRGIALCNASGVYDEPCAQHVVAMMMAMARQLPAALQLKAGGGWPSQEIRRSSTLLGPGQVVLLVGYGAIAKRVTELLAPFRMEVIAFRRIVRGDEVVPTHSIDKLDAFLPSAHHVVNLLPLSPSTDRLFSAERFKRFRAGARFYNIGRGDTVDQDALLEALRTGKLASAYLDVTTPEPLPPDHPLWHLPTCFITPHTAGGSSDEPQRQIEHFIDNLRRFERGESLRDRIV